MKIDKIQENIKKELDARRYEHSLGVAYTAACLAYRYGADPKKARLAGLLHDCAKQLSGKKALSICQKNGIPVNDIEKTNPFLLHGKLGAYLASAQYGVEDEEILGAITFHTTGRPDMTLLEKIIYIADYIEPNRDFADNLDEVRSLAFSNLDDALLKILSDILDHLKKKDLPIDSITQSTYDFYKEIKEDGE